MTSEYLAPSAAITPTVSLNGHASDVPLDPTPVEVQPVEEKKKEKEPSQSYLMQQIIDCEVDGLPALQVFRTPTGTPHVRCWVEDERGGHFRNYPLSEKGGQARKWLCYTYKEAYGYTPNGETLARAIEGLGAKADYDAPTYPVFTRIGYTDGKIYLDMANEAWQAIEVSADGWRVIGDDEGLPVRFVRGAGMLPLPTPLHNGSLDRLGEILNIGDSATMMILQGWLVGCLQPDGARAHLAIYGERGTAKTSAMRYLKSIVDPNVAIERGTPKDEDTIAIAARSNAVMCFDNFSSVATWLSDALCRLSTGAASGKRTLYADLDETLTNARRPCVFTGIETVVTRGDLLDRMITIELQPITHRLTEASLNAKFAALHPSLLGAVLDAASAALRNHPNLTIADELPRLADFARWVEAAAPALGWAAGEFLATYADVRAAAIDTEIDADIIARAVLQLAGKVGDAVEGWAEVFNGTASDLYALLKEELHIDSVKPPSAWPKNPQRLSGQLKSVAPALRAKGIEVTFKRTNGANKVLIHRR